MPTPRAGVIGWPLSHSLSPRLHGFWLRAYGLEGSYDAIPVEPGDLASFLRALPAQDLHGVNVTVPHKEAAFTMIDSRDDAARRIGAVNLIVVGADGKLHGRNTDAFGFSENLLSAGFKPDDGVALVLGAGGAARAVIVALIDLGFEKILIANRTQDRAENLARILATADCAIQAIALQDAPRHLPDVGLLVNTTSLGMKGQPELVFPLEGLPVQATVADIVYTPLETALLRQAGRRGHKIIDGLGMLLHQARPSFAAFFGRDPVVTQELRDYVLAGMS